MVLNCSPDHDSPIGIQRDFPRSNFEIGPSRSLRTILFVMTSGDLNNDLTRNSFLYKSYRSFNEISNAVCLCRYNSCFSRSDGGQKGPSPYSEPLRARPE